MNKIVLVCMLILGISILAITVEAKSCFRLTPEKALEEADSIFLGKVLEVNKGLLKNKIVFEKEIQWKGDRNKIAIVYTEKPGFGGQSIGYDFVEGESYLIYTYKSSSDGKFWVNVCGVKKSAEATNDIATLNNLTTPETNLEEIATKPNFLKRLFGWFKNLFSKQT